MSVPTEQVEIRYAGTGLSGPFAIPFPFLDAGHIFAAIAPDSDSAAVLLPPEDYTVTRATDGSSGTLTTVDAVEAPAILVIFRELPLLQPTTFPLAGPFPSKSSETALDRLLMQVQQLNRRIGLLAGEDVPIGQTSANGTQNWAAPADRGALKPEFAGQLGVERSTQTVWIGQSATAGDWREFRPRRTNRLILGYLADAGSPGAQQTLAAEMLALWAPDAVLFAGDNNYNGIDDYGGGVSNYDNDWAAFADLIAAGKAYPALGNHDVDFDGWEDRHAEKFPYLPQDHGGRYYRVTLGNGLIDLFVLHSGFNSIRDLVEPDGNTEDSVQHAWFLSALETSTARWKIAMFHHPPISLAGDADRVAPEMAWPELARMDLILCGHAHILELLRWNETMLANLSAIARDDGSVITSLNGDPSPTDRALWANDEVHGLGRIVATEERLEIETWGTNGVLLHSSNVQEFPSPAQVREQWRPVASDTEIGVLDLEYIATITAPCLLRTVGFSVAEVGAEDLLWQLFAGEVLIAGGTLTAGQSSQFVEPEIGPQEVIPRGTQLRLTVGPTVELGPDPDAKGLQLTALFELFLSNFTIHDGADDLGDGYHGYFSLAPSAAGTTTPALDSKHRDHLIRVNASAGAGDYTHKVVLNPAGLREGDVVEMSILVPANDNPTIDVRNEDVSGQQLLFITNPDAEAATYYARLWLIGGVWTLVEARQQS